MCYDTICLMGTINLRGYDRHPLGLILEKPEDLSAKHYERLIRLFLNQRMPLTRKAYLTDMRELAKLMGCADFPELLKFIVGDGPQYVNQVALAWKEDLLKAGKAPASINRKLSTLRVMFKALKTVGLINWTVEIENVPTQAYRNTAGPGVKVIGELIKSLEARGSAKGKRDLAIVRLLFDLGLRRDEVSSLDLQDLNFEEATLAIMGKGHRQKSKMSLPASTISALTKWVSVRGDYPGPLFVNFDKAKKGKRLTGTSIYRIIRALGREIGREMSPHGLRHSCITTACEAAAKNGIPFEEIRQLSRHKNIKTVLIYRDQILDLQAELSRLVSETV